jgi:hypothetical protein
MMQNMRNMMRGRMPAFTNTRPTVQEGHQGELGSWYGGATGDMRTDEQKIAEVERRSLGGMHDMRMGEPRMRRMMRGGY